ncbi:PREDICTED: UPF0769 protein C21orf59-like [Priapulus caudatus]|uniref:UPF0769 protein C21orf59-like n=1 Tax=Priapulus caudatus TaxID=37621 RepID=A0ABM1E1L7_PRICU|nr:PREDICTED: UPF0769 protein C21orf59-like [Priapulus caudatus]
MVKLQVKYRDELQFLYETVVDTPVGDILKEVVAIYNGRLKVQRLCSDMEELASHGVVIPHEMQGLTDEQVHELKLRDEWVEKCVPSGGYVESKDPIGRRNGRAPNEKMAGVITRTVSEAKAEISKKQAEASVCVTQTMIGDALDQLRGASMIVYPMGLPPHDPVRMEIENREDLTGTQASQEVIDPALAQLWWAGKELQHDKALQEYVGKNEKTKIVVKLNKRGLGAPAREPICTEEQKKQMMLDAYRRQEQLKKLEEGNDESYLDSDWSDSTALKKNFHGMSNVKWRM